MKFAFVLLTIFALTICNTDLEATINREKAIQCIRSAQPVLEEITEIFAMYQDKKFGQFFSKVLEVVDHVKEIIGTCIGQKSNDVVLQIPTIDDFPSRQIAAFTIQVVQWVVDLYNNRK